MKKKVMVFVSAIIISGLALIGCDMTSSIDKIKDPVKKVYIVIEKLIPILNDLQSGPNVPDNVKQNLGIAVEALTVVEAALGYAVKVLGIDLTTPVIVINEKSVIPNAIEDLKNAVADLDQINKKNK